jgi:hypothetical protein
LITKILFGFEISLRFAFFCGSSLLLFGYVFSLIFVFIVEEGIEINDCSIQIREKRIVIETASLHK